MFSYYTPHINSVLWLENIILLFDELTNGEKANKMTSDSNREEVLKAHISWDCTFPGDFEMQSGNAHSTGVPHEQIKWVPTYSLIPNKRF